MKKILLYVNKEVFEPTDYHRLPHNFAFYGGNTGNLLFYQACRQYILNSGIEFDYYDNKMSPQYINENYSRIIFPTANLLSANKNTRRGMNNYTQKFQQSKIPVYVLGIGAQAPNFEALPKLYSAIKNDATDFIKTIYNTGGQFSLRGYFTEELFHKLGFKEAVVTGCPSLYQQGRNLQVSSTKVNETEFKPLLNGTIEYLCSPEIRQIFTSYPQCEYVDQDQFLEILYHKKQPQFDNKTIAGLLKNYSFTGLKLVTENRVKLIADFPVWKKYIQENNFNFSFGQRIHGNIISILSNVPAIVHQHDSRTRELAEFFEIPTLAKLPGNKTLYEIYQETDYSNFNHHFAAKYDNFSSFLNKFNILPNISQQTEISCNEDYPQPLILNAKYIAELKKQLPNEKQLSKFFRIKKATYKLLGCLLPGNLGTKYRKKSAVWQNLLSA